MTDQSIPTEETQEIDPNHPIVKVIAFACADGRFMAEVTRKTVAENFGVQPDEVSVLTFYGPDLKLSGATSDRNSAIDSIHLALENWPIEAIVFTGHEGCRANPVHKAVHCRQIAAAISFFRTAFRSHPEIKFFGLFFRATKSNGKHRAIISRFWHACSPNLKRHSCYGWVPEWLDGTWDPKIGDI